MIDLGLEKQKMESLHKGWNLVRKNIDRIAKMTKDMLSYASTTPPVPELCSLNDIVDEVCELMADEAKARGIRLVRELDPSSPQVNADPEGIHTCLLNLVTNAIEAFPKDVTEGQVTVSSRDGAESGMHLQVKDTGKGMSREVQERIFLDLFSTKGARGTGLGLAITKKIVQEHGGVIEVDSEPNKGSCFTIILPQSNEA